MKKYGKDVICVDATHGTNAYDLITVLVAVAWAITNSEDMAHLVAFLTALKGKFIHTCLCQYFNAWNDYLEPIMLRNCYDLGMSTGHVDRAWRKALNTHILDKDDRVYNQHSDVMFETDLTAFWQKLQQLLSFLSETHPSFSEYFDRSLVLSVGGHDKADTSEQKHVRGIIP